MYTSVLQFLCYTSIVHSFTIIADNENMDIASKYIISMGSMVVPCYLTDIVIISAPMIAGRPNTLYYLTNPKGVARKLDIKSFQHYNQKQNYSTLDTIRVTFVNETKVITPTDGYKVFNVNFGHSIYDENDTFAEMEDKMDPNEFMIGPLSEDDYGNWILSAVYKNNAGQSIELYKIITLDITETVPGWPRRKKLRVGETFKLGFAYPIRDLESCELIVPRSAFDRFYDKNRAVPDICGYIAKNVTKDDSGVWHVIGVGRVTYRALILLEVI